MRRTHFHARYGSDQASVEIQTLQVLGGRLGPLAMGWVVEQALLHREDLVGRLAVGAREAPLNRMAPLVQEETILSDVVKVEPCGGYQMWRSSRTEWRATFQEGVRSTS